MAAVTVTVFAPFIMIFHPIFQMEYFSYNNRASTFIPNPVNLRLILLACLVLIIMLGILAYKRNMKIYVSGIFLFGLSVLIAYLSTQNYLMISQDKIERHHFFTEHQYQWGQLDEIVYEYVVGSKGGDITFTTKSGDQFIIKEKEVHSNGKTQIYHFAMKNNVNYIEREKK